MLRIQTARSWTCCRTLFTGALALMIVFTVGAQPEATPTPDPQTIPPTLTGDYGLDGVVAADMITRYDAADAVGPTTIYLNWAYADPFTVTIEFEMQGRLFTPSLTRLFDSMGDEWIVGPVYQSGPTGDTQTIRLLAAPGLPGSGSRLLADDPLPESLDFILVIDEPPSFDNSTPTPAPEGTVEPGPPTGFRFDFTVPVQPLYTAEPDLTVEAGGLPLTVERVEWSATRIRVDLCYPEDARGDQPPLEIMQAQVSAAYVGLEPIHDYGPLAINTEVSRITDRPNCLHILSNRFYDGEAESLELRIDSLNTLPVFGSAEREQIRLWQEENGVIFTPRGNGTEIITPDGRTLLEWDIDAGVALGLLERIEGPWIFSIPLTQES